MRAGLCLICLLFLNLNPAFGARNPAADMAICQNAAVQAADRHGIPREVLVAITLVETGTNRGGAYGAWPWTVNVAGKGFWLDSRAAALLQAQRALARGQPSFDVGCFQLNYKWHGQHFASIDHMFEPGPSGDYAARFLKSLYAETGDWIKAAGYYHSRTQKHAVRYRSLVAKSIRRMGGKVPQAEILVASSALRQSDALRTSSRTTLWPLQRIGSGLRSVGAGQGRSGGLGLTALRRSTGALVGNTGRGN